MKVTVYRNKLMIEGVVFFTMEKYKDCIEDLTNMGHNFVGVENNERNREILKNNSISILEYYIHENHAKETDKDWDTIIFNIE